MKRKMGGVTVMVVPEDGGESRSFRLSRNGFRATVFGGLFLAIIVGVMTVTWWFLALEAVSGWRQEALLDSLQSERGQLLAVVDQLGRVEAEYSRLRSLFGPAAEPLAPDLWLPPVGLPGTRDVAGRDLAESEVPSGWPLTEPGFVTQIQTASEGGDHPGLDIAVATDSYIRASGAGQVLRTGEDGIYGRFVVLEHGQGYQSVYAHASMVLVARGQTVRRGEVIGLTGSTGRSTAPHLHFEVLLNGLPVDPLTLVDQPG